MHGADSSGQGYRRGAGGCILEVVFRGLGEEWRKLRQESKGGIEAV